MADKNVVYITYIHISVAMTGKLGSKKGLTVDEVRDTFQAPGVPRSGAWDLHPVYGLRLYVEGVSPSGDQLVAILQQHPTDPDEWYLRTVNRV